MKPKHLLQLIVLLLVSVVIFSFVESKKASRLSCMCKNKINCAAAEATTSSESILFDALSKHVLIGLIK